MTKIQHNSPVHKTNRSAGVSRSGSEMSTCLGLKDLKNQLRDLTQEELQATSAIETRGIGEKKEYVQFHLVKDDHRKPRCPNEPLPLKNDALLTMVEGLSKHYGKKADNLELAFLKGGLPQPGYVEVTLVGTGLGLPFEVATGRPMGKLTGSL